MFTRGQGYPHGTKESLQLGPKTRFHKDSRSQRCVSGQPPAQATLLQSIKSPHIYIYPIGSMYAIYGHIYHQYTPNVSIYIPYMDPMGIYIY